MFSSMVFFQLAKYVSSYEESETCVIFSPLPKQLPGGHPLEWPPKEAPFVLVQVRLHEMLGLHAVVFPQVTWRELGLPLVFYLSVME